MLNTKAIKFLKNFSYTLSSNLITLLISTIVTLIVPKLIGVEEYGYWQLYSFYLSYLGFLHFGWVDGIYLRYGGEKYDDLDSKLFFSQFIMLVISQLLFGALVLAISNFFVHDIDKDFILKMIAFTLLLVNTRTMLLFIMQATNRIKEYAKVTLLDKIVYILLISFLLLIGVREYRLMIIADVIGKTLSLFYAIYCCKAIVCNKLSYFYFSFKETIINISVGIKLMFSNIASTLIIGTVKFGIEWNWNIGTFGKISLTLSISNMLMLFINAVGIVIYPILRRTNQEKLSSIYTTFRNSLIVSLYAIPIAFYPIKVLVTSWLPQYSDSLIYLALLFPMFIYEGKMALLVNTYLKTLRKEKKMLQINIITLSFSIILTLFATVVLDNLDLAVFNIILLIIFRSIWAEVYLTKVLLISIIKDVLYELVLTIIFILSGWFIDSWIIMIFYSLAYACYLFVKKDDISHTIIDLKHLIKKREVK